MHLRQTLMLCGGHRRLDTPRLGAGPRSLTRGPQAAIFSQCEGSRSDLADPLEILRRDAPLALSTRRSHGRLASFDWQALEDPDKEDGMSESQTAVPARIQIAAPFKAHHRVGSAISLRGIRSQIKVADGINAKIAVFLTNIVGSMWCAYVFAIIAFIGLPAALRPGGEGIIAWIAQTFLQLVLLSVIMVGQNVQAEAGDIRSKNTYDDTVEILDRLDVHTAGGIKELADKIDALEAKILGTGPIPS